MLPHNEFIDIFSKVLTNTNDDNNLVRALVLDAMYNDFNIVNVNDMLYWVLNEKKNELNPSKIMGLVSAIVEYQMQNSISELVYEQLTGLLRSRIFDNNPDDFHWIKMIFKMYINGYSFNRLDELMDLMTVPRAIIPKDLIIEYKNCIQKCLNIEMITNPYYKLYTSDQMNKLGLELKDKEKTFSYAKNFYSDIIKILKNADIKSHPTSKKKGK